MTKKNDIATNASDRRRKNVDKGPALRNRIAELRLLPDFFINQDVLAEIIGISKISLGRYERCEREIPGDVLARLADYFHCSIDYILYRTDDRSPAQYEEPPYGFPYEKIAAAEDKDNL